MRTLVLIAACLGAAACTPYDPDLGEAPFTCGTDAPRCPDGYEPVDVTPVRCECHRAGTGGNGNGDNCGDTSEPNDDTTIATATAIGPGSSTAYNALAVCPASDRDLFSMDVARVGTRLTVQVDYDQAENPPHVDILDSAGSTVNPTVNMVTARVTATFVATESGRFYAEVSAGTPGEESHYDIRMTATTP